jgi:hypothetical protein
VLFSRQPTPFLTTLHGRLDLLEHQPVFTTFSSIPVISISNAQRRPVPQSNWVRTIHHGLPEKLLTPQPVTPGYLAVVCTENLNPNVLTMKSAQYGARIYDAGSLNLARDRRILVQ